MKAPFPYFGGKFHVAHIIWERLGNVPNYIEPFFGSGAVLLSRPHKPGIETVNDIDCYLANFWRALQAAPEEVAYYADWPVNEADLHARHRWLINQEEFRERMKTDPDYYVTKIAGWWVWGISQWIGSGWCDLKNKQKFSMPRASSFGNGVHSKSRAFWLVDYFKQLAKRLRYVRVCCGNWDRIIGPSVTLKNGLTGVFLDPPYGETRDEGVYAYDDLSVNREVAKWAIENGDNPMFRIALCGYEGEYQMPDTWECYKWKANGGYGNQGDKQGRENAERERIWFSPHCLKPQLTLFA